ncbi:MAG: hypothetical protein ACI4UN_04900, partial [Muribaculaceae bacterium]
ILVQIGSENTLKPEIGQQANVFILNLTHNHIPFFANVHKIREILCTFPLKKKAFLYNAGVKSRGFYVHLHKIGCILA